MIWEELKESLILTNLNAKTYEDVMKQVGQVLIREGYCKDSYIDALIKREQEYPTGLDVDGIGVAIPHTEVCYVMKQGVAIAVLSKPVTFALMGTDDSVDVKLVFMLAVINPNEHLDQLQRILAIIQDTGVLNQLAAEKDAEKIIEIIREKEKSL